MVTSRPYGYQTNPLRGGTVLEVRAFDQHQIKEFVYKWYLANEIMSSKNVDRGVRLKAQESADELIQKLVSKQALFELSVSPLLLTMITTVHRYRSSLPERRVELYAEIFDVFLGKRRRGKGLDIDLTPAQKRRVLKPLAYSMMQAEQREISTNEAISVINLLLLSVSPNSDAAEFLKHIEESSGLLIEKENNIYSFAHLTFQECLAAMHARDTEGLVGHLAKNVSDSWWHETIRLYSALGDASKIIQACLLDQQSSVSALTLAFECVDEALEVQPDVRDAVEELIQERVEDTDPTLRDLVAEAMLSLRIKRLIRLDDSRKVDIDLISHAEYQLFLDEMYNKREYYQPDHWQKRRFPKGSGNKPVAGVRPSDADAFCKWLTAKAPGPWQYRIPLDNELEQESSYWPKEIKVNGLNYWVKIVDESEQNKLSSPFDSDPSVSNEIVRTLASTIFKDFGHVGDLASARGLDLVQARRKARIRARQIGLQRDHILDLDHTITRARALSSSLSRAHTYARTIARTRALSRVRIFAIEYNSAISRAFNLDRDRLRERDIVHIRAREIASAIDLVRVIANGLDFKRIRTFGPDKIRFLGEVISNFLDAFILLGFLLESNRPDAKLTKLLWKTRKGKDEIFLEELMEDFFNISIDFIILHERIEGSLNAFEGIRIVAEQETSIARRKQLID